MGFQWLGQYRQLLLEKVLPERLDLNYRPRFLKLLGLSRDQYPQQLPAPRVRHREVPISLRHPR